MDFPEKFSFTITNACNLRCRMCGQWSREGYMHGQKERLKQEMDLADWMRLVDELSGRGVSSVLIRGGEPFLFPGIVQLLEHLAKLGVFVAIDTNGTLLGKFAADIVRIGNMHLTISVDGPEAIHDAVRGVPGCYAKIKSAVAALQAAERETGSQISKSINFTISKYSIDGLGAMPDVARDMGIETMAIVPYYFYSREVGEAYEKELREGLGCRAYSWAGFHHEDSGVDPEIFKKQYAQYLAGLDGIHNYPYMPLSEAQYLTWFADCSTPVGPTHCKNVEKLIDIQPNGDAGFCVDLVDYTFGNVRESTIETVWNSERAERFREYRRKQPLAVCHRCGAKYMSDSWEGY